MDEVDFKQPDVEKSLKNLKEHEDDDGLDIGMGKHVHIDDSGQARPAWDNQVQFLLACIAYAVGLGNIWRFPYLAQTYGGGAFIIPYLIMLAVEGIPLFLLELAVGQRLRQGAIGAWESFHPYLGGIGMASAFISFTVGLYYNTIIAWCFWYICNSFTDPLPYAYCPINANGTGYVEECLNSASTTDYFWWRETLNISEGMDETGGLVWWIVVCLVLSWTVVWVAMIKGIESSGKAMYVTATFPYLVLIIFLVRGLTLRGSTDGISYLFTPDFEIMKSFNVWLDAATQIFFSLGLGFGGVIAFASYNPKKQNCQRDALIIAFTNSFTSIFASIVIFSILGYKATLQTEECTDVNIGLLSNAFELPAGTITYDNYDEQLADLELEDSNLVASLNITECNVETYLNEASQGTGLAFIVFTEAIINMPGSPVWSVLFFLMLLSLGLGSMFGTVEGVVTPLFDLGLKIPKPILTGLIALVSCLIGLLFCTRAGNYWLDIFNDYAGSIPLLVVAVMEITTVAWFYGIRNFNEDLEWMFGAPRPFKGSLGQKILSFLEWFLFYYFRICWLVISPVLLIVVCGGYVYTLVIGDWEYSARLADASTVDLVYPWYAFLVIAILVVVPILLVVGVLIIRPIRGKKTKGLLVDKDWSKFWSDLW